MSRRSMREQLDEAFGPRTGPPSPWNPSRRAVARVKNPLPMPDACPHCGADVEVCSNAKVYGGEYGEWPWVVACTSCDAYVGLHPYTGIPLGTLATRPMRKARKEAKAAFNPIWQDGWLPSRSAAYAWLAEALGIENMEHCHIAWFDVKQCAAVLVAVDAFMTYALKRAQRRTA